MERVRTFSRGNGTPIRLSLGLAAWMAIFLSFPLHAAYLLEIDTDGLDDGVVVYNSGFAFGGDTTATSSSSTVTTYGTTGGDSIFGGDGVLEPDTYIYTYAPDTQADNLAIPAGTDLGEGNLASGIAGGAPGVYDVYTTFPFTENVTGGPTQYDVSTAGDSFTVEIDQNNRGDAWILLGQINYTSGDITVTQQPTEGNTFVSQRAYGVLFEVDGGPVGSLATFAVDKDFDDDNPGEVEVTISCNTGLPLEQTTTISEGDGVVFVVDDFADGEMNCEVSESGELLGYESEYDNGTTISEEACVFEGVGLGGGYACTIENTLLAVEVEVSKFWVDENPQFNNDNYTEAIYDCVNEQFGSSAMGSLEFVGQEDVDSFTVFPHWDGSTSCSVTEVVVEGGVEFDDSDCQDLSVTPGVGASCSLVNTRFYEGIPALDRNGLAILVLLMLGIGFTGLRRFT